MNTTYTVIKGNSYKVIHTTVDKPATEAEIVKQLFAIFANAEPKNNIGGKESNH